MLTLMSFLGDALLAAFATEYEHFAGDPRD
jgi:hypothetical protein